jgi:hypothetical protein|tara:strand:+ start:2841 stop:3104 length:264 start_codon:yes stop_codon:yes gene_type:complete
MKTDKELIKWALEESPVSNKDIVTQLENLKLWSQNPTAYAKKISKENDQRNSLDSIYKNMTPFEKGHFNHKMRKKYGHNYIRFRKNK